MGNSDSVSHSFSYALTYSGSHKLAEWVSHAFSYELTRGNPAPDTPTYPCTSDTAPFWAAAHYYRLHPGRTRSLW